MSKNLVLSIGTWELAFHHASINKTYIALCVKSNIRFLFEKELICTRFDKYKPKNEVGWLSHISS